MDNTVAWVMFAVFFSASLLAAYNLGWQRGHDVHHDDDAHGPTAQRPPNEPLWR